MRPIDGDALLAEYDRVHVGEPGNARKLIENAPTIEERKKGKWSWKTEDKYECSCCHEIIPVKEVMNVPQYIICPMCGADMRDES